MAELEVGLIDLINSFRRALQQKSAPEGWTLDQIRSIYVVLMDIAAAANVPTSMLE